MTDAGPGLVYGLFQFGGFVALAVPISASTYLLDRWRREFVGSLVTVLTAVVAVGLAACLVTGFDDPARMRLFGTLWFFYVVWPLGIAAVLVRSLDRLDWDSSTRLATAGWAGAHASSILAAVLGPTVAELVDGTPTLLGMASLSGYVLYMTALGVLGAAVGTLYYRLRRPRW